MSEQKFRVITNAVITNQGDVLIGKKEDDEEHPIGGEWHFPGGHLETDEEPEEAVEREVEEETDLEVDVHQIIDVYAFTWRDDDGEKVQVLYHCESGSRDARPEDDLQDVKWVSVDELEEKLSESHAENIEERERIQNFLEKLEKMPAF